MLDPKIYAFSLGHSLIQSVCQAYLLEEIEPAGLSLQGVRSQIRVNHLNFAKVHFLSELDHKDFGCFLNFRKT